MALNKSRPCVGYSCWLSTENHFIWSFIGPACLIILVRSIRFLNFNSGYPINIIIIYQLLCRCCLFTAFPPWRLISWLSEWSSTKCTGTPLWKNPKSVTTKTSGRIKDAPLEKVKGRGRWISIMRHTRTFLASWFLVALQVLCTWCHGPALRAGSHLDLWSAAHPPWDHPHCLPVHHQQHLPGDVHLHFPLRAVQKGNPKLGPVLPFTRDYTFIYTSLLLLWFQIQEEYYRLFKNVPCCFECLRWMNTAGAWASSRLVRFLQQPVTHAFIFGCCGRNCLVTKSSERQHHTVMFPFSKPASTQALHLFYAPCQHELIQNVRISHLTHQKYSNCTEACTSCPFVFKINL